MTRLKWRVKAATEDGKSTRFNFIKYKARSSRKIVSIIDPNDNDRLLTDPKHIANAFASYHQKKTEIPNLDEEKRSLGFPDSNDLDFETWLLNKHNLSM